MHTLFVHQSRRMSGFGLSLLSIFATTGCFLENQKAEESFEDKRLPAYLEELANPRPTANQKKSRLSNPSSARLSVAIIDNGVDYLHPALLPQIKFTEENGQITGAGYDVLGSDNWAHPNLINPELFSFGAESVKNGIVSKPLQAPLAKLQALNDSFMEALLGKIQNHDILKNSLFRKVSKTSLTFLGAEQILQSNEKGFDKEAFAALQEKGMLINEKTKVVEEDPASFIRTGDRRLVVDLPWTMSADAGFPRLKWDDSMPSVADSWDGYSPEYSRSIDILRRLEHADVFFDILSETMVEFKKQSSFEKYFQPYFAYRSTRESDRSNPVEMRKEYMGDLQNALYTHVFLPNGGDALNNSLFNYCGSLSDSDFQDLRNPSQSKERKHEIVEKNLGNAKVLLDKIDGLILNDELFSQGDKNDAQKNTRLKPHFERFVANFSAKRGEEIFYCEKYPQRISDAKVLELLKIQKHPFLSSDSSSEVHGTHVAGIVAAQDPSIDIVPVRVATSTIVREAQQDSRLKNEFIKSYENWLTSPLVLKAASKVLRNFLGFSPEEIANPAKRTDVTAKIMELVAKDLQSTFENDRLDFYFFDEIVKAIRYVGEQQIKVANVSLGTSFERVPSDVAQIDQEQNLSKALTFLRYEFFKNRVATEMDTKASQTLFVIAAGNDGKWLDGETRSALPCDLSSPYLASFEAEFGGEKIVNNRLSNILCVGSIDTESRLSYFTNLPITKVPFVFSLGENILSSIKTTDCTGADEKLQSTFGPSRQSLLMGSEDVKSQTLGTALGLPGSARSTESEKRQFDFELNKLMYADYLFSDMRSSWSDFSCAHEPVHAAKLSGTSMATPAVAGYTAHWILAQMEKEGNAQNYSYNDPRFSPQAIIKGILDASPELGGTSIVGSARKVVDIKGYIDPHREAIAQIRESFQVASGSRVSKFVFIKK